MCTNSITNNPHPCFFPHCSVFSPDTTKATTARRLLEEEKNTLGRDFARCEARLEALTQQLKDREETMSKTGTVSCQHIHSRQSIYTPLTHLLNAPTHPPFHPPSQYILSIHPSFHHTPFHPPIHPPSQYTLSIHPSSHHTPFHPPIHPPSQYTNSIHPSSHHPPFHPPCLPCTPSGSTSCRGRSSGSIGGKTTAVRRQPIHDPEQAAKQWVRN